MTKRLKFVGLAALLLSGQCLHAEMTSLDDGALSDVSGEGIGLVLEDFSFEAGADLGSGNNLDIKGITNSDGDEVVLSISQFYIAGDNSNQGDNVAGNTVNLGRLLYPWNIELVDGDTIGINDKAIFEFSAPDRFVGSSYKPYSMLGFVRETRSEKRFPDKQTSTGQRVDRISGVNTGVLSGRATERADIGVRFDLMEDGVRAQSLEAHATGVSVDGSYVRLWGSNNEMVGNFNINFYASTITMFACDANGNNCGQSVNLSNFVLESALGYGEKQPVTFEVDGDGNFTVEVGSIAGHCTTLNATGGCASTDTAGRAFYSDYYSNGPRTDIYIGQVTVGSSNFGSATIANLQVQYLRATSHDL